jgi:hypothetical protein
LPIAVGLSGLQNGREMEILNIGGLKDPRCQSKESAFMIG